MSYEGVHAADAAEASLSVDVATSNPHQNPPTGSPFLFEVSDDEESSDADDGSKVDTTAAQDEVEAEAEAEEKRITPFDAVMHLMKGNLGPGCLNLPHAFALSGWLLGIWLFALVVIQGVYSMWLLVYCKDLLRDKGAHTFMDVARYSLGSLGGRLVQTFLFILQAGVCCVFLSLISTNLQAQSAMSDVTSVACVTFILLFMVLLRFIKDLRWLSTIANCLMVISISTAAISGMIEVLNDPHRETPKRSTNSAEDIATFVSSMFFSFEGIGLVLPVENSFTAGYIDRAEEKEANIRFRYVLVGAMSAVASLFAWIGLSASVGYPDIHNGSVTAYLERKYPDNEWYGIVNSFVMIAVLLTFPLQLNPAMEVLDEWFAPGCIPLCYDHRVVLGGYDVSATTEDECQQEEVLRVQKEDGGNAVTNHRSCCGKKEWVLRRWLVVFSCAIVVLLVDDLGVLMSLFGAIGQTGLALLPCACHLSLQRSGEAPRSVLRSAIDVFIIAFSIAVFITGCVFSFREIIEKNRGN